MTADLEPECLDALIVGREFSGIERDLP